jgi:tetratricopeptide (TPR) repeat protein
MKKHKLFLAVLPILLASSALAQTIHGTGKGLDQLDEVKVDAMLSTMGMTSLLNRDFDNFKVSDDVRDQVATLPDLQRLASGDVVKVAERRALAVRVAHGLDASMGRVTDGKTLLDEADQLQGAVLQGQAELEIFGDNPIAQEQLKTTAETDIKMYERAAELAGSQLTELQKQIKTEKDYLRLQPQIDSLGQVQNLGSYRGQMSVYQMCLGMIGDDAARTAKANDVIAKLQKYDAPDNGVQPNVKLQIGKLYLVQGNYDKAKEVFDAIAQNPGNAIQPDPTPQQQNLARYFAIVAEIRAGKLPAAESDITVFEQWQRSTLVPHLDAAGLHQIQAMMTMLKFRIDSAQSDQAADPELKKKKNDDAMNLLAQLIKEQPDLRDLVFDQLISRVPADADLGSLPILILQGKRQLGFDEVNKPAGQPVDSKKINAAIAAARELIKRNADKVDVDLSAYFIGRAYQRMEQFKDAVAAFLDYAQRPDVNVAKGWGEISMDLAGDDLDVLRKKDIADPQTRALYDRYLPVAINPPYNRKVLAFRYATLLAEEHKYADAVKYFKMVEPSSKQYAEAQYFELKAMAQELAETKAAAEVRKDLATQIVALDKVVDQSLATAKTEEEKKPWAWRVRLADWEAAHLANSVLKDPGMALQILDGYEARVAPASDPTAAVDAMSIRTSAYLALGKTDDAMKILFDLLKIDEEKGKNLMFSVRDAIVADMAAARLANNIVDQRKYSLDLAELSTAILSWASKSSDAKVKQALPAFQLISADSKRTAAELAADPKIKLEQLNLALADYRGLAQQHPDDAAAQQGIGYTQFDLQHWDEAIKYLAPLVNGKKVGEPYLLTGPAGAEVETENTDFWQANYELVKAMVEQAKKNPKSAESQKAFTQAGQYIGALYVTYPADKVGGKTFHQEYENLKNEVAGLTGK